MSEAAAAPRRSSKLPRILLLAALAGGAYAGYQLYLSRLPYEWTGTVEARTISVGSRTGGRVKEVLVREGDALKADQPLIILEPADLPAQLLEATGQLHQMQANLEKLEHGARPEELEEAHARALETKAASEEARAGARREQIAAAAARLAAQEVAVEKARIDDDRIHQVKDMGSGAVSQSEIDAADMGLKEAVATRDALREQLDELKNGTRPEDIAQAEARALQAGAQERLLRAGTRAEDLEIARGQVASAQAKVDQIQTMIDELVIKAPRAARLEACDLRPGDILAPNATAATLLEAGELYVRIYVPETQIGHIGVGQTLPITVDSFPGQSFEGIVEHISGVGEYTPRNLQTADERADQVFATRVGLRTGREELRAGMAAFVRVAK
jgi:multidrug resistance efflux pump